MRRSGNSDTSVCVANILQIYKGEVPYTRYLGMSHKIDSPAKSAMLYERVEIDDQIETYEPRANVDDINLTVTDDAVFGLEVKTWQK